MGEKDIWGKILMSHADVFADCENVLVYGGQKVMCAENLRPAPTESFYQGRQRMHSQFCDISFYLVESGEIRAQYMIGNEMRLKRRQVLRKASYQGGAYRQQLESGKAVYPVMGMVIEWARKSTHLPMSLHALLEQEGVRKENLELVDDVKLPVFHMNHLPKETRDKFTSDIGFVADYLNEGSFENRKGQEIVHVEALCEMMEALTGDIRFTALVDEMLKKQKEGKGVVMCEYIDMLEARGQARGEAIGEARGQARGENRLAALLTKLYALGREEDARQAVKDENIRKQLYQELRIAK